MTVESPGHVHSILEILLHETHPNTAPPPPPHLWLRLVVLNLAVEPDLVGGVAAAAAARPPPPPVDARAALVVAAAAAAAAVVLLLLLVPSEAAASSSVSGFIMERWRRRRGRQIGPKQHRRSITAPSVRRSALLGGAAIGVIQPSVGDATISQNSARTVSWAFQHWKLEPNMSTLTSKL